MGELELTPTMEEELSNGKEIEDDKEQSCDENLDKSEH